jgi:hypothetical protein
VSEAHYGLVAEFESAQALEAATRAAKGSGYGRLEAFSPFPLAEVAEMLNDRHRRVHVIALVSAAIGAAITYGAQYWLNVVDYPINVGGRPMHSWPAFVPATVIVGILWGAAGALVGALILMRLPRLNHPVFEVQDFGRAMEDRFFLCILADDPKFDLAATRLFLGQQNPVAVREVPVTEEPWRQQPRRQGAEPE